MCRHIFDYPVDKVDNYTPDKETLMGVCRNCGLKQISYGMKWMIPKYDEMFYDDAIREIKALDKEIRIW